MRERLRATRARGQLVSGATYILAFAVTVPATRAAHLGHPLADLALGTLLATAVVFAVSVLVDNSSVYDPYWSLQPVALAGCYVWMAWGHVDTRLIIVTALLVVYGARLTSNFYRDWPGLAKEDFRYVAMRRRFGRAYWPVSFFAIHLFPTIMVFLGCLPLHAIGNPEAAKLNWLDIVAAGVTLGAIVLAFVADEQLRRFRHDFSNHGRIMQSGLWALSRHPNYVGEVATWWGLWLFAVAAGLRWWWTVVGAIAITLLFVFVSVPWMEKRLLATREDEGYAEYRRQTPMLLPWPWRRGRRP